MEYAGLGNVTRSYFRQAVGIILVYDIGNRDTLDALRDWVSFTEQNISWEQRQHITFVMWGNNRDQTLTAVSEEQLNSFLTCLGLSEDHCFDVNAYTGYNVFESYQVLVEKIHLRLQGKSTTTRERHISVDTTTEPQESDSCSC